MLTKAREFGVKIISGLEISSLLQMDNKVLGALGLYPNGDTVTIKSKATILATGGLGQLYPYTTNPLGVTGEGYIMALEAGATLKDMEFIQFLPTCLVYPSKMKGAVVTDTLRGEGAILLNSEMERFMTRYSPEKMEVDTRDVVARSIYQEIIRGKKTENGGVYIDAREVPRRAMIESFTNADKLIKAGVDPREELIEVAPFAHFCCGGVTIDEHCRTGIEGLWAAGEVTGGIHGANRLGSNALTENLVFGQIAGREAAIWSREHPKQKKIEEPYLGDRMSNVDSSIKVNTEEIELILNDLQKRIQETVWKTAGIIRNKNMINEGLAKIKVFQDELATIGENNMSASNFILCNRLKRRSLLAEVILRSALERKESRGTHYRDDFPNQDNKTCNCNIEIKYNGEKLIFERR